MTPPAIVEEYEDQIVQGLGTVFDAALIGAYVALVTIPAMAVATGEVSFKLALTTGIFAGLPQGLRYVLKQRDLLDHANTNQGDR